MKRSSYLVALISVLAPNVLADSNDWVNPAFVLQKTTAYPKSQQKISSFAKSTYASGPWDITNTKVAPPSGNKRDYLSWAPYHWPDCNWCPSSSRQHMSTGGNRTNTTDTPSDDDGSGSAYSEGGGDDSSDDGSGDQDGGDGGDSEDNLTDDLQPDGEDNAPTSLPVSISIPMAHRRMMRHRVRGLRHTSHMFIPRQISSIDPAAAILPTGGSDSSDSGDGVASSPNGAQNARKTGAKGKPKPTKTKASSPSSCTPSPSKSLPPSATWTMCPYVVRDGKLNPDVRSLPGVQDLVDVPSTILFNSLAWVFNGADSYAEAVVSVVQGFFLDPQHGINPNINFGQVIRGPGKQHGQYLGLLDFRGMAKLVNGIQVLRLGNSPAWTNSVDASFMTWTKQYLNWVETSDLGQTAASAPNNHGTFYVNQRGSLHILLNDPTGAKVAVTHYFSNQFKDQIAASGEQPFEAIRTRPFHYRCFNLEAMITNAKLGDQLGLDFWTAKSKYGSTIQDALNYVMNVGPGKEDISDCFPHVASVAAAYGDPTGKYDAYLKKNDKNYMVAPYYYYNQPGALTQAPTVKGKKGSGKDMVALSPTPIAKDAVDAPVTPDTPDASADPDPDAAAATRTPDMPFECPAAFAHAESVQLDDGVFVTCDELKPLYGYLDDVQSKNT